MACPSMRCWGACWIPGRLASLNLWAKIHAYQGGSLLESTLNKSRFLACGLGACFDSGFAAPAKVHSRQMSCHALLRVARAAECARCSGSPDAKITS